MAAETKPKQQQIYNIENTPDDFDFELPNFASQEEAQSWLDSLPREDANVDKRLMKRVAITVNLNQLMIDGFGYLAKLKGLSSSKDLIYMVLSQYLNENLPDEF